VRPWLWFNLLNIDAPLVAVAWQVWFARCFGIALAPLSVAALAMTVWMIYATDRLLDVRGGTPKTERHRFHRDHAGRLVVAVGLCFVALLFTAARLNTGVLHNGLALSGCVALYFLAVHSFPKSVSGLYPKEMAVGVVFAMGVALAPWSRVPRSGPLLLPVALFAFLCFLNCAAIETWEWKGLGAAVSSRPHALTLWLAQHLRQLSALVAIAGFFLLMMSRVPTVFAAIIMSALGFLWLDVEREHLPINLVRVLADVPLLSPLILLLGLH
jgi:hypothetical protein